MGVMDIVTRSQFEDFVSNYGFSSESEDRAFELFSIFSVLSKYIKNQTITKTLLCDVNIGDGGDWGLDGIAILVNGRIVTSKKEVDDLLASNGYLHVRFVFVQAKNTSSFSAAALGNSLDGVENILSDIAGEDHLPIANEALNDYLEIIRYIYSKTSKFQDGYNPGCDFYYVCRGKYNESNDFENKIVKAKKAVTAFDLTQPLNCTIVDKRDLVNLYKETKVKIEVAINIGGKRLVMPETEKDKESDLCLIPFKEFKKLIVDEEGKLIQSVFYDNIRDFQGMNVVNEAMTASLREGKIALFTAMNNGITVVTAHLHPVGEVLHLRDYQIVNGCQTCNVLYQNMDVEGIDNLVLPVKIIASQDKQIRDSIIVANNSQTEVKREQLVSLLDCQREIEDYYNVQKKYEKLYYERRSKQYSNDSVPQNKVITISAQIKAFVAMMMEEPDQVGGYYGRIVKEYDNNGKEIFSLNTEPCLYYTCALADYKMDELFSSHYLPRKLKKVKFHLLYAFRLMCEKEPLRGFNSNKAQDYCDHLCQILCDDTNCREGFKAAEALVLRTLGRDPRDGDRNSKSFTSELKKVVGQANARRNTKK